MHCSISRFHSANNVFFLNVATSLTIPDSIHAFVFWILPDHNNKNTPSFTATSKVALRNCIKTKLWLVFPQKEKINVHLQITITYLSVNGSYSQHINQSAIELSRARIKNIYLKCRFTSGWREYFGSGTICSCLHVEFSWNSVIHE